MWKKLQKLWKNLENRKDWAGILFRTLVVLTCPIWGVLLFALCLLFLFLLLIMVPIYLLYVYITTGKVCDLDEMLP